MNNLKREIATKLVYVTNDWEQLLTDAMTEMDYTYLKFLENDTGYIPAKTVFLNAFQRLPLYQTRYILFGQDPYPRKESAIGEAFIDGAVKSIWSDKGLSKEVNKATSLRNMIKMLLLTHGLISHGTLSQSTIAKLNKQPLIETIFDLRDNFVKNGVLLLNTALVYTGPKDTSYHTGKWKPFVRRLLREIPGDVTLILLGNFAVKYVGALPEAKRLPKVEFEHPFNVSFIYSNAVQDFFKPMNLIYKHRKP